jgi:hypothetical protein
MYESGDENSEEFVYKFSDQDRSREWWFF